MNHVDKNVCIGNDAGKNNNSSSNVFIGWYAGAGATLGLPLQSGVDFDLGAVGELGLEYRFEGAPIVLGLDYRPTFTIIEETDFDFVTFGLNVRYVF